MAVVQSVVCRKLAGLGVLCLLLPGCKGGEKVTAPTSYSKFTAPDKTFRCVYPNGWEKQATSAQAIQSGVVFRKGAALIDINSDLQGALMGDIARSAGGMPIPNMPGMPALPKQKSPVEAVHDSSQKAVSGKFKTYEEQKAQVLTNPLGEARISEFNAESGGLFPSKQHGYRITILGGERRITVLTQCREEDWPTLKPAFRKVIGSLTAGGG